MAGVKIYELAREIGMPSKDVAAWAIEAGFAVKTHMSSVDEETAEKIRKGVKKKGKPPAKKAVTPKKATPKKAEPKKATKTKKSPTAEKAQPKTKARPAKAKKEKEDQEVIDELEALERQLQTQVEKETEKKKEDSAVAVEAPEEKPEPPTPAAAEPPPVQVEIVEEPPADAEELPIEPEEEEVLAPPEETKETEPALAVETAEPGKAVRIPEVQSVKDLAELLGTTSSNLLMKMMGMGMVSNVNSMVSSEVAAELAIEFGFEPEVVEEGVEADLDVGEEDREEDLVARPPVVTVMGHVDHGKTSLLDAIRETSVTLTEAGSITQHIGAYHVTVNKGTIVFLDTPGHEAFTAMRARGAQVTDIVVLVVAANDGVMPQTREAVAHAKAAEVPIVVAVNKIDLPNADPEKPRRELSELGLIPEDWGGDSIFIDISAKQKLHIDDLLEMILLQAEIMELKGNPNRLAKSIVLEAELDKGRGPIARVLVQQGTIRMGDPFVVGPHNGKVRALINDEGRKVQSAGPSMPVEVLGLSGVPQAGDILTVMEDERKARQVATQRMQRQRQAERVAAPRVTLEDLYRNVQEGVAKELAIVLKADAQGSIEALKDALEKLGGDEVRIRVIHSSVGGITESDIMLATASNAIIIGFHVRPTPQAATAAQREEVDIRLYTVIYDAIKEVESAMSGLLEPTIREVSLGRAEVREVFHVPKVGSIAGSYITDGKIPRNALARIIRDNVVIYEGKVGSLRRFKEDVAEVASGYECGISIENFQDIKQGDVIEPYALEKVERTL
jgi:translation initiation factor IF-2